MTGDALRAVPVDRIALLSLEPWDQVWRRNQHLAAQLVGQGLVGSLLFVGPPGARDARPFRPVPGITVLPTIRVLPKRAGGIAVLGRRLRAGPLRRADLLWINDPELGAAAVRRGQPAVYDVTDDWRLVPGAARAARRIVRAEDRLAARAGTVVCSAVLARRWWERYGIEAAVVRNGVDEAAWAAPERAEFEGAGPHLGYVGTLHDERLDVRLLLAVADALGTATLHLIGPSSLSPQARAALAASPRVRLHGAVPADRVPAMMRGLDVLLCPHRVTPFTLSLDAIKAYEYAASGRPIVATPTSGFQELTAPQLVVAAPDRFVAATRSLLRDPPRAEPRPVGTWAERAREFRAAWPC